MRGKRGKGDTDRYNQTDKWRWCAAPFDMTRKMLWGLGTVPIVEATKKNPSVYSFPMREDFYSQTHRLPMEDGLRSTCAQKRGPRGNRRFMSQEAQGWKRWDWERRGQRWLRELRKQAEVRVHAHTQAPLQCFTGSKICSCVWLCVFVGVCKDETGRVGWVLRQFCSPARRSSLTYSLVGFC